MSHLNAHKTCRLEPYEWLRLEKPFSFHSVSTKPINSYIRVEQIIRGASFSLLHKSFLGFQ